MNPHSDNSTRKGPTPAQINSIVEGARWAPSGDNNQSFSYEWDGEILSIQEDAQKSGAFINVENSASHLALGMCLANIELCAVREGWVTQWTTESEGAIVAKIKFVPAQGDISPADSRLVSVVQKRAVDRRPFHLGPIPGTIASSLEKITQNPWGIKFHLLDTRTQIEALARLNSRFESFLIGHQQLHSYLFRWIRWSPREINETQDGMPLSTMGLNWFFRLCFRLISYWPIAQIVQRTGLGLLAEWRARRAFTQSAAFGAFSFPGTEPLSYVRTGWLWQRAWLSLTVERWHLQPVMGYALLSRLCPKQKGAGGDNSDKNAESLDANRNEVFRPDPRARLMRDVRDMRDIVEIPKNHTIAAVFRMGRPTAPLPARAPRRSISSLLTFRKNRLNSTERSTLKVPPQAGGGLF